MGCNRKRRWKKYVRRGRDIDEIKGNICKIRGIMEKERGRGKGRKRERENEIIDIKKRKGGTGR